MIPRENQRGRSWIFMILALLLASATALAGTTGNLAGYVTGPNNAALPGVKVIVTSPVLQGAKTATTDAQGFYRLTQLPPGDDYKVRFEVTGYKTTERIGVTIHIDETIKLPSVKLQNAQESTAIEVIEEKPIVAQDSTTVGRTMSNQFLESVPTGRTTTAVLALAPGSSSDSRGVSFRGATSPENNYVIDGLNTTGIVTGLSQSTLPPEFIQEIQVKTGGYEPEYGRATGGQAIVITKSGGNEFHGDVFAYITPIYGRPHTIVYSGDSPLTKNEEAALLYNDAYKLFAQVGFDIGGYIVKDRLWFFAGYAPTMTRRVEGHEVAQIAADQKAAQEAGETYDPELDDSRAIYDALNQTSHYYLANLTFNINQDHSLRLSASGNPTFTTGAIGLTLGDPSTYMATSKNAAYDTTLTYNGKFLGGVLNLDAILGYHKEARGTTPWQDTYTSLSGNSTFEGQTFADNPFYVTEQVTGTKMAGDTIRGYAVPGTDGQCVDRNGSPTPCYMYNYHTGGYGAWSKTSADRFVFKPILSIFLNNFVGNHVIKIGGDMERNHLFNHRTIYVDTHRATYNLERYYTNYGEPVTYHGVDDDNSYFNAETRTVNTSAFIQDNWSVLSNLSLNLGVRWERQQIQDVFGISRIDIADNIAPRLGATFDFTNQGRSKLFANWGRYYESIPQDINDRALSAEGFNYYYFATATTPNYTPGGQDVTGLAPYALLGGEQSPIQSNLKGQYSGQFVGGFQYEVVKNLSVELDAIYNKLGNVIEDISPDNGNTYVIANPGTDNYNYMVTTPGDDGKPLAQESTAQTDANGNVINYRSCIASVDPLTGAPVTYCFPKAQRAYRALELSMQKRFSHNWQGQASYTLSQTYGNYPGLFSQTNGQLDPNITSQFDLPNLLVNRYGQLNQDRRHVIKIAGSYTFNFGTSLGVVADIQSGSPIAYLGYHPVYQGGEAFLLPIGTYPTDAPTSDSPDYVAPRTPWIFDVNLSAHHTLQFANKRSLALGVQVNNVLNMQRALTVDQNYTYDVTGPTGGATALSEAQCYDLATGLAKPSCERNPSFGAPVSYQNPFNVRFEAKFSF
jgi:hypothetical protein